MYNDVYTGDDYDTTGIENLIANVYHLLNKEEIFELTIDFPDYCIPPIICMRIKEQEIEINASGSYDAVIAIKMK